MKKAVQYMLCVLICCITFFQLYWSLTLYSSEKKIKDCEASIQVSLKREEKQNYEYNEAVTKLPEVQATLAEKQPVADALKKEETELRETRKVLREEIAKLKAGATENER